MSHRRLSRPILTSKAPALSSEICRHLPSHSAIAGDTEFCPSPAAALIRATSALSSLQESSFCSRSFSFCKRTSVIFSFILLFVVVGGISGNINGLGDHGSHGGIYAFFRIPVSARIRQKKHREHCRNVARRNTRGVFKYFFIFFIPFAILFSSERSSLFL